MTVLGSGGAWKASETSASQSGHLHCYFQPSKLCFRRGSRRKRQAVAESNSATHGLRVTSTTDKAVPSKARLVSFKDGAYTVKGSISTSASLNNVWTVLTDYPRLADVFSNILSSGVASSNDDTILHQDCKWEFLIFSGKFKAELSVKEDLDGGCLTFKLIASSFMKDFVGQWQLQPHTGGGCLVEHILTVEPIVNPPPFMQGYTQKIFVQQVASILNDLEQEMVLQQSGDHEYADL